MNEKQIEKFRLLIQREFAVHCTNKREDGTHWFDINKFTEMIIRECADIVERDMDYHGNWCDDKILNRFGLDNEPKN